MARPVWTLFVALVTIGVVTYGSKGFLPADGSTLIIQAIHEGAASPKAPSLGNLGRESLAQSRNSFNGFADEETFHGSARNPWRDEDEQESKGNSRSTWSRQLEQASPSDEVEVLMAFKAAITSDPLGALASWNSNDSNPCQWMGVTCSQSSNRIVALQLDNLLLTGTISPLLGTLTLLQRLNLSANSFHGTIPSEVLNCSHLTYLALRDNDLSGTLPSRLGDLQNLQYLDVSNNLLLGGSLSASVGNCSYLRLLHLDFTIVGGKIPSSLGQLAQLESLNISMTLFSGTIPKSLGNCSALTYLDMGNVYAITNAEIDVNASISVPASAYLSGELPEELGQLTNLQTFGVFGANIVGAFPSWIANVTSFKEIGFVNCFLTGEIPEYLGMLPSLELLVLSGTDFTGEIPKAISNCSNLWILTIELNSQLSGVIPPELGLLGKLGALYLDNNNLIGTIPSSLSNCSRLRVINLGTNPFDSQPGPAWVTSLVNLTFMGYGQANLVGEIPATWGQIAHLDTLDLSNNNLNGGIPASLGNCTSLADFSLQQNELTGEIPSEIWNLQRFNWFNVEENYLTGSIPESIGNWSQITICGLDQNFFSGEIPSQLGMLQNLRSVAFDSNNFTGPIPVSVGNCSALFGLYLDQNQLTGSIPSSIGNLTSLQQFTVPENLLEGQIPVDLMRCNQLVYLDVSLNFLIGIVPNEIGQLVLLQQLILGGNQLSGNFPRSIGLCQGLLYFDISFNKLSGSIPGDAVANLSSSPLSLNVSQNFLTGVLPDELGDLRLATHFNFSGNHLSGSIPSALGGCQALETLDLSTNNLSGGIPPALGNLQFLVFVNMSNNDLEGPLPDGGVFNSSNLSSAWFLGNPGLCGSIFLKDCPADLSRANSSKCRGFHCNAAGVVATSVGAVVALLILCVITYNILSKRFRHWRCFQRGSPEDRQLDNLVMGLTLPKEDLLRISTVPQNIIGVGDRSKVYKEALPGGKMIAIKIVSSGEVEHDGYQVARAEFHTVKQNLANIKHRNIVKVLGLMSSQEFTALFLEYMPNGSLHKQLYEVEECVLGWEKRLNIAMGVAEGLFYLHSQAHESVIHRDLKPGNILLDENMVPKLADFGISKYVSPENEDRGEATVSRFCGTMGYIPPEYGASTRVSTKGDVYSYGVVLLELLTRTHPLVADNNNREPGQQSGRHIVDWIVETQSTPLAVVDPMLLENDSTMADNSTGARTEDLANEREQMKLLLQVGLLCTQNQPDSRPGMGDVLGMLKQIQRRGSDLPGHLTPSLEELANQVSNVTQNEEPVVNSISR